MAFCQIILEATPKKRLLRSSKLYTIANVWKGEYENIAKRIAVASILYIDETGWKVDKRHCDMWVFGTVADAYYRYGVGRNKDVLTEVLGEKFAGTGVRGDEAADDSIFSKHQLDLFGNINLRDLVDLGQRKTVTLFP